jgi:hypothetical protein
MHLVLEVPVIKAFVRLAVKYFIHGVKVKLILISATMGCGIPAAEKPTIQIGKSLIHLLQANRTEEIIKKLESETYDIFERKLNYRGDTILHYACSKNNLAIVQYLKKIGANFNVRNNLE